MAEDYGWSLEAFCAMLGSVAHEGAYNPGQMEVAYGGLPDSGHGLIQWTNANWGTGFNPLIGAAEYFHKDWYDGLFQCEMINNCDDIEYMRSGTSDLQWGWIGAYPPLTFEEFKTSKADLQQLVRAWYLNVERPPDSDETFEARYQTALMWYERLQGVDPTEFVGLQFVSKVTASFGALTTEEIENNVKLMFSIFCGNISYGYSKRSKWMYYLKIRH